VDVDLRVITLEHKTHSTFNTSSFISLKYLHTKLRLALTILLGVIDKGDVEVEHIELVGDDVGVELIIDEDAELVFIDVKRELFPSEFDIVQKNIVCIYV
ncbi:unnamed protein product, partial [Rotaria sp. Silwood2]